MSDWPRVGFVAGTLGPGGAERQLYEQCRILVESGVPPVVLALTQGEEWELRLNDLGVETVWVGRSTRRSERLRAVVSALRQRRVGVIQASHGMTNLYAATAGRVLRKPSIGALRTTPERVLADLGRLGIMALRSPDRLAGNSPTNLAAAVRLGVRPERIRYVPNAVDLRRFTPLRAEPEQGIDVVFVGRLGPEKRIDVLIAAIAQLKAEGRSVSAVLVGSGPLEGALRDQARTAGVDALVRFVGRDAEPERWYRSARLLVLASDREGMPNVVLEAMACGLPVVATPVGSVPDLVDDGRTGRLVGVGDPAGLSAAIGELLDDPLASAAMGEAARRRVERGFDAAAVEVGLRELYLGIGERTRSCVA